MRAVFALAFCLCAFGQPRFEVASVKPSTQEAGSSGMHTGNGRLNAENVTLRRCIQGAYAIGPNLIFGGPDWLDKERFQIDAKTADPTNGDAAIMQALQGLLAERFHLKLHRETRTLPAYVLDLGKSKPKLEKAPDGAEGKTDAGRSRIIAQATTMDHFAEVLSRHVEYPVVNRTGLDGRFNLKLEWTPESNRPEPNPGPSIFSAVQEQLGLRLRAQKAPIEVIVIDHAEKPSEN
jgi:uncharacterized protein (TIGR03435 family)